MAFRKSKSNYLLEPQENGRKPSFEEMMNESESEIEGQEIEQSIVDRFAELKELSDKIDKATQTLSDAKLKLDEAIKLYDQTKTDLKNAIDDINGKVDSINSHIDNLIKDAPTKLKVSVRASDADYKMMKDIIEKHRSWVIGKIQWACVDFRESLSDEWQKISDRYKQYDGTYLGHYVQYFFWFFCVFGIVIFGLLIFMLLNSHYHWMR